MPRFVRALLPLAAATYVGVGVAAGIGAAGASAGSWVGATLCLFAVMAAGAGTTLEAGPGRGPLLVFGCLAGMAFLPAPFQPVPAVGAGAALVAAIGFHAVHRALLPPNEETSRRDLWLVVPYGAAVVFTAGIPPLGDLTWLWQLLCLLASLLLAAYRLARPSSLLQEAMALRAVLTLFTCTAATLAAWLFVRPLPGLAGAAAAALLVEGLRRALTARAREDMSYSAAEPITTVLVAGAFGAMPVLLDPAPADRTASLAMGAGVFGAVLAAPAIGRAVNGMLRRLARRRSPDLVEACDDAARITEEALGLEELAEGLRPLAEALPRGNVAVVACDPDTTAILKDDEIAISTGAGHGPAFASLLAHHRLPVLASNLVDRAVRETDLRPGADLVAEVAAELVVPLPCGDDIVGALLVGRPRRGRLRAKRGAELALFGAVIGPRLHAGVLVENSGRRLGALEQRSLELEELSERKDYDLERLAEESRVLRADRAGTAPGEIVGRSRSMKSLLGAIDRAASSPAPVLIKGEPGAGRVLVARTLHHRGEARSGPLVRFDCKESKPEAHCEALLGLESESDGRPGLVELANGGSLLIEEITVMSLEAQAALVRVLSSGEVLRLGSPGSRPTRFQLIATTGRDLDEAVGEDALISELRDRVAGIELVVPPLRDRRGDIPRLSRFFLEKSARRHGLDVAAFTPEALDALEGLEWPGNVRQLRAVVEHSALSARGKRVQLGDLPCATTPANCEEPRLASPAEDPLEGTFLDVERRLLERALAQARGNKSEAARNLGMKRTTFMDRLKKHGLL